MKLLRRLLLIVLSLLLLAVLAFAGVMAFDALSGDDASAAANTTFTAADGTSVAAYVARPAEGEGPFPAMLMVHEWWGLNAEIAEMAELLAEQGYVVFAPDTYRGRMATTVPGALALRLSAPVERVNSDMQAAFDALAALPGVDTARIGVMGFCYGGGVALRHAVENDQIAATINLYGDVIDDPANFGALATTGAPLLGIFGERDMQIPLSEVEAFRAALAQTSIPHTVTVYAGMPHAFVNPKSLAEPGEPQNAWNDILSFLMATLGAG